MNDESDSSNAEGGGNHLARVSFRQSCADRLPFFLRAWWLREFEESCDLTWPEPGQVTGAVWSRHSDPLCDAAGVDFPDVV